MRMIGIGLMGFLLAGVALLLSTMNLWEKAQWAVQTRINGAQLVFETPAAMPVSDEDTVVIARSNPDHAVILSGLPAYQGVTFNLPLNARPTSGYLQIDATLQVLAGVEGVLRVSIDNVRRGEMLLHPGEVGRSLRVLLSPTDLAREQLVVSFSLQGNGPSAQCSSDAGYAAIVEIETTSVLHLTLDRPLTTISDRVNAWGGVVRVGWPKWLDPKEQARRLVLATRFKQADISTVFLDGHSADALSTVELRQALPILVPAADATHPTKTWPQQIALTGANAGLRRFRDATRWRINADLRDNHHRRIPAELELHLALGRQALDDQWAVTVTLNDRLLHQDLLDPTATHLETRVSFPSGMVAATNMIEVTVTSTRANDGHCSRPQELIAEMLPETTLIGGDATFADALTQLQTYLSDIDVVSVGSRSTLSAADADAASDLLARIAPIKVTLKPEIEQTDILVVMPGDATLILPDTPLMWFVSQDTVTREVTVNRLVPNAALPRKGLGLLVIPGGADLSEVAL